ncbi:TIGR03773 family transporter-associated surface protein [Microbacterium sp. SLBN-146]|uniref:TIGR03773 family transporter-associated surface protein n=1 Tax=Microbacterium sp. SLBN-146 TaxID=2768457 RepID=UPI001153D8C3|nr:TIGR03773 family transporter-associated surface protein [Microbacterium sp. SLBN-146]TQJ31077.1 putative ABC transporter-associated repeat protein [Microbacterium sp. SLBN-146]
MAPTRSLDPALRPPRRSFIRVIAAGVGLTLGIAGAAVSVVPAAADAARVPLAGSAPIVISLADDALVLDDSAGDDVVYAAGDDAGLSSAGVEWSTSGVSLDTVAPEPDITLQIVALDGPGDLEILDATGAPLLQSASNGRAEAILAAGESGSGTWSFTEPGEYTIALEAAATLADSETVASEPRTYRILVVDPAAVPVEQPVEVQPAEPSAPVDPAAQAARQASISPLAASADDADVEASVAATATPIPTPSATPEAEQCIATPVTTTVRPDNVGVVSSGHLDFGPVVDGSEMRALFKDDRQSPAQWVDPGTIVIHLADNASVQAPGGDFAFLGGGTVWQIPLTQDPGIPWLGWNTQHPTIAGHTNGTIALTLDGVDGPGDLVVYSLDSWGGVGNRYFGTVDGFPRSTAIEVGGSGVHVHGIWAFTQPGAYHVTLTFSGDVDGQQRSGTSVLTFFIGSGDAASAAREQTVTTYVGRTADGEECTVALADTGLDASTADLAGLSGTLVVVGLALFGAAALAPRPRRSRAS